MIFPTWQDIKKGLGNKNLILFGAGNIAEKTRRKLPEAQLLMILDNASNLWGELELGVEVKSPEELKKIDIDIFIIIATTSFREVSEQLETAGLRKGKDFAVSPILNDLRIIDELESIERSMIFSSGSPVSDNPTYGGGIYEMNVSGSKWSHKKKISGNCYGVIKNNDKYVTVDADRGIFEFDREYKIVRSKELPRGIRAHGISYHSGKSEFYVVCSYMDAVLVLDEKFDIKNQINVSKKYARDGKASHHCNDCTILGDSLYVSMFSVTGNWKNDVFDGGVIEYDLETGERVGQVVSDLWMPHNISVIDGGLMLLDSLPGNLLGNNFQTLGSFPAFTRGLASDGIFYYIGQSRNRNFSKNLGFSKNVSIDAGIIVFDSATKVSRFLQLPPSISEVHSINLI